MQAKSLARRSSCSRSHAGGVGPRRVKALESATTPGLRSLLPLHRRHSVVSPHHARDNGAPRSGLRPDETEEQALQRRLRESQEVEERVTMVENIEEFDKLLRSAGKNLVVLEVQSDEVCQTGFEEEAEVQWKADQGFEMSACNKIKHTFVRTARSCSDVVFLEALADTPDGKVLCEELGVDVLPTVQFWREGKLLWEHRGYASMEPGIGEGVLYYGDEAAGGVKASDYVGELGSEVEYRAFVEDQAPRTLTVVYVALQAAQPCITIYPAVLALAKNFSGDAVFARLIGDSSPELARLITALNVLEVPTFIFYRNGQEIGRHVGGSRGDLIGQILQQQAAAGIAAPTPPARPAGRR